MKTQFTINRTDYSKVYDELLASNALLKSELKVLINSFYDVLQEEYNQDTANKIGAIVRLLEKTIESIKVDRID